jgi:hypothetical protein
MSALTDYSNPRSLGSKLRSRRKDKIASLISEIHERNGRVRIIDLGGREVYWRMFGDFLKSKNCSVALLNTEQLPPSEDRMFTDIVGDACNTGYEDNAFDLVHSNSVIEHVGLWTNMVAFAREVRRLAPAYYVQTPYYWCPVDPHAIFPFHHWLPTNVRTKLMTRMRLGKYPKARDIAQATQIVHSTLMLDREQMRHLFPDASLTFEWFGPIPKSLLAIRLAPR